MRSLCHILILATVALVAYACSKPDNNYSEFHNIDHRGWVYGTTLTFVPEDMVDSVAQGQLCLVVRHTNAYPYNNIWLEVSTGSDTAMLTDTVNVKLADVYGNWLGNGSGLSYQLTDTLSTNYTLVRNRPIKVRHIMRIDTLPEIEQIGIIFNEQKAK